MQSGMAYLRGELRWAPVHKGCCLGGDEGFMRKVPAVRGVQDVCFGWARIWFGLAVKSVESGFVGGGWGRESVKLICESEVSIILAFRVRISRICRSPLGRAGPSAFCSGSSQFGGHVIPLDLSTVGLKRGPIPSDIDRGELFFCACTRGPCPWRLSGHLYRLFSP